MKRQRDFCARKGRYPRPRVDPRYLAKHTDQPAVIRPLRYLADAARRGGIKEVLRVEREVLDHTARIKLQILRVRVP